MVEFVKKFKAIKNKEIYIAILLCVIALAIFFGSFSVNTPKTDVSSVSAQDEIESKIQRIVASIDGAGKVSVAVTYATNGSKVYAYETKTVSSGNTTTNSNEIVTSKGSPVLVSESNPQVKGVVVVAEGADNARVRIEIIRAVVTLLDIDTSQIEVFTYKK